ncbi:MAG: superoxide dismutase family protein [Acidobacteria bacterium]|nr:superoxide dismutase family protein [Acidobacteriota bacterium]MBS1866883.1 superoxide dismutase family protein [Acidobacteriota bacterium]
MKLVCKLSLCAAAVCLAAATGSLAQEAHTKASARPVVAEFKNADGLSVGTATLSDNPKGVKIKLDIKGLPAGEHSIHIHQNAKCEAPDFKSAGPHFNPMGGMAHDHSGAPAGDIPDFTLIVAADGTAHVSVVAPHVTMGDDPSSVFTNGGTAIVIHAVATAGSAAPARIACAIVKKSE